METPLMDNFLSNLPEDKNGNIVTKWLFEKSLWLNSLIDDTHSPSFDFSFVFAK